MAHWQIGAVAFEVTHSDPKPRPASAGTAFRALGAIDAKQRPPLQQAAAGLLAGLAVRSAAWMSQLKHSQSSRINFAFSRVGLSVPSLLQTGQDGLPPSLASQSASSCACSACEFSKHT